VPRAVLTDIEGTTSSISFVKDVLFPYSSRALPAFVRQNAEAGSVRGALEEVWRESGLAEGDVEGAIRQLLAGIEQDRKLTALKSLQGMVWKKGFEQGAFTAHVYPDAFAALTRWHERGIALYVYSSGSVEAQELFFGHSDFGDLRPLFSGYFDTVIGSKHEGASYRRIAERIGFPCGEVLFLSDVIGELDAAAAAGMQVCQLIRPEDYPEASASDARHPVATSFSRLDPMVFSA
jgi:enolase-phosphatase E1